MGDVYSDHLRLDWLDRNPEALRDIQARWARNEEPFDVRGTIDALMAEQHKGKDT